MRHDKSLAKVKVAILTGILDPYKAPIYRQLSECFSTTVILSGKEDNRVWDIDELRRGLHLRNAWGFTVKWHTRDAAGRVFYPRYVHINPGYAWELARARPDAIISSELGFRTFMGLVWGKLTGTPVWVWVEATTHTERNRSAMKRFVRRKLFAKLTRHWISSGLACTQYLHSLGVANDRIVQVQLTPDEVPYSREAEPASFIDLPRPRALVVGQMVSLKGLDNLLDALEELSRDGTECSLILVGDGPEAYRILERARKVQGDRIAHIEYASPWLLPSIYKACDFLVFASLQDVWGLVVSEAILAGLPVISSIYAGSTVELVAPNNHFDPLDSKEFVEVLGKAIRGDIAPSDPSRIRQSEWVADVVARSISREVML